MRLCIACKSEKPLEAFSKHKSSPDGIRTACRMCCKAQRHSWYLENAASQKDAAAAYAKEHPDKAAEWQRKAQKKGREKYSKKQKERYWQNRNAIRRQMNERYRSDVDFRSAKLASSKRRRELYPDAGKIKTKEWCAQNSERNAYLKRRWTASNPERAKLNALLGQQRRRVRVRGIVSKITKEVWLSVLAYHAHSCAYCFRSDFRLTVDHLLPVSRGGTNEADNLVPACIHCNSSKSDRTPLEFLACIRL